MKKPRSKIQYRRLPPGSAIKTEKSPDHFNREDGFKLSRMWKVLLTVKKGSSVNVFCLSKQIIGIIYIYKENGFYRKFSVEIPKPILILVIIRLLHL